METNLDVIRGLLTAIHPVPDPILEEYLTKAIPVKCERKELLTREGQVERYLYLVVGGVQRAFAIKEGKEQVIAFTYAPSFSGIPESFLTQTAARYNLECVTASSFLRVSYQDHEQMMAKYREIETLSRKATEQLLLGFMERQLELLSCSMEERFLAFMGRSKHLLNKVPHKYIASYLHLDPTNFSKLLHQHWP